VVTVTKGFRHDSIPTAEATLQAMAARSGGAFTVDFVRDDAEMARKMTAAALKGYDGVFFVNTTGELPLPDRDAFLRWIAEGRGFVGAHAATDTFHGYDPYVRMIGAEFKTHGAQSEVECRIEDPKHPATRPFAPARSFKVFDEIYQFTNFDRGRVRGLLTLDQHPNTGAPGDYPIAWCRNEGKGRVFYTALGHRKEVWEARWYQDHLWAASGGRSGWKKVTPRRKNRGPNWRRRSAAKGSGRCSTAAI
jgi:type 1 glutamine amidotransferase